MNSVMTRKGLILLGWLIQSSGALYYCSVSDPCGQANSTLFYEPYARFENCQHNNNGFCDRYITPQWYRINDVMLTQCPSLLSCGTLYPVWLNGTLPGPSDEVVDRKACKVGFESCCTRTYDIQIKHCGSFYAYCLAALDTCPERYCFGTSGACEIPSSSVEEVTTTTAKPTTAAVSSACSNGHCEIQTSSVHVEVTTTTTTVKETTHLPKSCADDPCIENNVRSIDHQESRSLHCEYKQADDDCDDDLTSGWYKSEFSMVTLCPGLLSCGSIYPVWINGTIPGTSDGVVTRQACQRGFHSCCSRSYNIKVRNCGAYTAYCLGAVSTCPSRYCFGTGKCQKEMQKNYNINDNEEHGHRNTEIMLGVALAVLLLILLAVVIMCLKRHNKARGRTGSFIDVQMTETSTTEARRTPLRLYLSKTGEPPPYSP